MTRDPRRLLDDGVERDLLASARDDGPSAEAERSARIALGLAVPLIPVPPANAAVGATTTAAAKGASTVATIKIAAISVAIAGGAGTASWVAMRTSEPPPAAAIDRELAPERTQAIDPDPLGLGLVHGSSNAIAAPEIERKPAIERAMPKRRVEPDPVPDPAQPSLQIEIELLRAARKQMEAGDFDGAEKEIDRYRREIGSGALREEAEALGVETAFALDRNDARERAETFIAAFPDSPHTARARTLLRDAAKPAR